MDSCDHDFIEDGEFNICVDCGLQKDIASFDPEWRYYASGGSKNPARCHQTKTTEKNIDKLVANINMSENVKKLTEEKYKTIVGKNTIRGKGRKAIVVACMFHVYKELGEHRTIDQIRENFSLTKQDMSKGLAEYYKVFKNDRVNHTGPEDLLRMVLKITGISISHYNEICILLKKLQKMSRTLNNSSPMSMASSVVYFYIKTHPEVCVNFNKKAFSDKVDLSDITITKLAKEICKVMEVSNDIIS